MIGMQITTAPSGYTRVDVITKHSTYITTDAFFLAPARHKISATDSTNAFVLSFDDGFGGLSV